MMKDWNLFAKTHHDHVATSGEKPRVIDYVFLKITDNMLEIGVFCLTLIFAYIGLFSMNETQTSKVNWALHAAELCLGVFLGLLKGVKKP